MRQLCYISGRGLQERKQNERRRDDHWGGGFLEDFSGSSAGCLGDSKMLAKLLTPTKDRSSGRVSSVAAVSQVGSVEEEEEEPDILDSKMDL